MGAQSKDAKQPNYDPTSAGGPPAALEKQPFPKSGRIRLPIQTGL
jgi:hypothetical protein